MHDKPSLPGPAAAIDMPGRCFCSIPGVCYISLERTDKGDAVDAPGEPEDVEEQFPGWHAWNVSLPDGTVNWYARPFPLVSASSLDELRAEIRMAHQTREAN
jgi:hypothetical protein